MTYNVEFSVYDFQFWSGAKDTVNTVSEHGKMDELQNIIECRFTDCNPSATDINDFVWFCSDEIYDMLGIENQ